MILKPIPERRLDEVSQEATDCISLLKSRYGAILTHDSKHAKAPIWIYTFPKFDGAQIAVRMNKQKPSLYLRGITIDGGNIRPSLDSLAQIKDEYGPELGQAKNPVHTLISEDHAPFLTPRRNPLLLIIPKPGMLKQILDKYLAIEDSAHSGSNSHEGLTKSAPPDSVKHSISPISNDAKHTAAISADAQDSLESDTRGLKTAEREAVVKVRYGQGNFREALFKEGGEECWMSGIEGRRLLVASHIKPWSHCDNDPDSRGQPDNGLLLSALWDAAFDAGLISFDSAWKVVSSMDLSESAKRALNLSEHTALPEMFRTVGRRKYLAYHRANVFESWKEAGTQRKGAP